MGCKSVHPTRSTFINALDREALQTAQPECGGYKCAADEDSANNMFHQYMINKRLVFKKQ